MNLERHLRVLWRRRVLVATGFVLACILAFLTAFSVTADGPKRRGSEVMFCTWWEWFQPMNGGAGKF